MVKIWIQDRAAKDDCDYLVKGVNVKNIDPIPRKGQYIKLPHSVLATKYEVGANSEEEALNKIYKGEISSYDHENEDWHDNLKPTIKELKMDTYGW